MRKINAAILGAGHIAQAMAKALNGLPEQFNTYAVASRDLGRAEAFAEQWHFQKAYGSYEALVNDPNVELIYVATPHSHHYEHARLCIEHGKPALVEKPFTANAELTRKLHALAEEKGVFVTEAMWTRYLPSRKIVEELLESGAIGQPQHIEAEFSSLLTHIPRLVEPALAGGALLDLGVYPLTIASMFFGNDIVKTESVCEKYETGVDGTNEIHLTYRDGKTACLRSSFATIDRNEGWIRGTEGSIYVQTLNNFSKIQIFDKHGQLLRDCPIPAQINGYEYEALACREAILAGHLECPQMPHAMTLKIMEQMDDLRRSWGVKYPFE